MQGISYKNMSVETFSRGAPCFRKNFFANIAISQRRNSG